MTTRQFLSDTDLDAILDALTTEHLPLATLDQLGAATREAAQIGHTIARRAVAAGHHAFLGTPSTDPTRLRMLLRPRLRMLLAVFGAGTTRLCPHTEQIRPQMVTCDPPTLNCMAPHCMTAATAAREQIGIRWDHQCDGCGRRADTLTAHLLALGPLSISGHLCETCTRDTATTALAAVDNVQAVGRKAPCPCGSGRRFKRCHGNQRTAV